MGNSFSQAATEQKKQEVNNVIADIMNCFLLRFIAHYKNRIICRYIGSADRFRKNAEAKQLSVCPPIDIPLITGIIGKQREWLKSWANRAVVICNEADNFRIDYYLPQLPVSKRTYRGSIYPVGYYIEAFLSDSEAAKMKDMHCIKLSSLSSNKRPWYLRVSLVLYSGDSNTPIIDVLTGMCTSLSMRFIPL